MGKTMIVTGGTRGIGRAIAERFAAEGFDIVTCSRSTDELELMRQEFEEKYPNGRIGVFTADLSQKKEVADFAAFAKKFFNGKIDVLVNNTGLFIPGKITEEAEGVLEQMIDTNLYSAYRLTRALIPEMMEVKSGHIFNMCSIASFTAYENGGSYSISKFAMLGMSKVLREEVKQHGIRVTAVMPGATYTSSWEGVELPEERFIKSEDVAEMVWHTYALSGRSVVEELVIRPQLGDL